MENGSGISRLVEWNNSMNDDGDDDDDDYDDNNDDSIED